MGDLVMMVRTRGKQLRYISHGPHKYRETNVCVCERETACLTVHHNLNTLRLTCLNILNTLQQE